MERKPSFKEVFKAVNDPKTAQEHLLRAQVIEEANRQQSRRLSMERFRLKFTDEEAVDKSEAEEQSQAEPVLEQKQTEPVLELQQTEPHSTLPKVLKLF